MCGTEARGRSGRAATVVQRAHFRAILRGDGVVSAAEKPSLPQPAFASRVGREAAVASAGLELRAVLAIVRQTTKQGNAEVQSGRMKVDRYSQGRIKRAIVAARRYVGERLVLWRAGRREPGVGVQLDDRGWMISQRLVLQPQLRALALSRDPTGLCCQAAPHAGGTRLNRTQLRVGMTTRTK